MPSCKTVRAKKEIKLKTKLVDQSRIKKIDYERWATFYGGYFDIDLFKLEVMIPQSRQGLERCIIIPSGLRLNCVVERMYEYFGNFFNSVYGRHTTEYNHIKDDRKVKGSYAIWVKDTTQADPIISFDYMLYKGLSGQTLLECLIHRFEYFIQHFDDGDQKFLDTQTKTICSGSRDRDNCIPIVSFKRGMPPLYISVDRKFSYDGKKYLFESNCCVREVIC
jgi:hypothetical protein